MPSFASDRLAGRCPHAGRASRGARARRGPAASVRTARPNTTRRSDRQGCSATGPTGPAAGWSWSHRPPHRRPDPARCPSTSADGGPSTQPRGETARPEWSRPGSRNPTRAHASGISQPRSTTRQVSPAGTQMSHRGRHHQPRTRATQTSRLDQLAVRAPRTCWGGRSRFGGPCRRRMARTHVVAATMPAVTRIGSTGRLRR